MLCRFIAAIGNNPHFYKMWQTREASIFMANQATKNLLHAQHFAENLNPNLSFIEPGEHCQHNNTPLPNGADPVETSTLGSTVAEDEVVLTRNFAAPSGKSYIPWVDQEIVYPSRSAVLFLDCAKSSMIGEASHSHKKGQLCNLLDKFQYVFKIVDSEDIDQIEYLTRMSMRHVATMQTRWAFFMPIKKVILIDIETGIDFKSPIYTKDGTLHSFSEIHDGVRVITQ